LAGGWRSDLCHRQGGDTENRRVDGGDHYDSLHRIPSFEGVSHNFGLMIVAFRERSA
jgi:hypothetical protein